MMIWRVQRITARDDGKPDVDWLTLERGGCIAGEPEWLTDQRKGHAFTFTEAAALRLALIANPANAKSSFYLVSEHQEAFRR